MGGSVRGRGVGVIMLGWYWLMGWWLGMSVKGRVVRGRSVYRGARPVGHGMDAGER